jgi:hypothetical protein
MRIPVEVIVGFFFIIFALGGAIFIIHQGEIDRQEITVEEYASVKEMMKETDKIKELVESCYENKKITNREYQSICQRFDSLTPAKKDFENYLNGNSLSALEKEYNETNEEISKLETLKIHKDNLKNKIQKEYKAKGEIPDFVFEKEYKVLDVKQSSKDTKVFQE